MKRYSSFINSGFTTIEIIIVILIAAIIAVVVIPKMDSQSQLGAILAAEMAASDIRAVQHAAMQEGVSKTIVFGGNDYTAPGLTPENRTLPGEAVADIHTVTFNTFGEPDQGGEFYVTCNDDSRKISIEALTGKVTIE